MSTNENAMNLTAENGVTMRSRNVTVALVALVAVLGCNQGRDGIDQVQTNIVDKAIFEGDWFYQETLIKLTGDNALFTGEFVGDNLNYDFGVLKGETGIPGTYPATENRIRWVIDKDVLLAFRADELVIGGNVNAGNDRWPLHVGTKVRQALPDDSRVKVGTNGTVTASDDASATVLWEGAGEATVTKAAFAGGTVLADLAGFEFLGEPLAAFPVSEHLDIRFGYNPSTGEKTNVRSENASDRRWYERRYMRVDWSTNIVSRVINWDGFADEPAGVLAEEGSVWPERWNPQFVTPKDDMTAPYANEFAEDEVYYMSFVTRRVRSPGFGCLFGAGPCSSLVYTVRSSFLKSSPNHDYVGVQEPGHMYDRFGVIRLGIPTYTRGGEDHPEDGIAPDRGETDFVNYWAMRHNMWHRHTDASGERLPQDQLWAPENIRGIHYMMSDRYPTYLIRPGLQVFVEWNRPFANMVRRYNGVATPEEGGEDLDCAITGGGADEYADGATVGGDYPDNYAAFDGDRSLKMEGSECYVSVQVNPCDVDPANACVELGDIRYHFFNLIPDPGPWFCGVSIPTADGRSGELISANINTTTQCLDSAATGFLDYVHVIRDGAMTDEDLITGEYVREYLANNGWVRYPTTLGPEGPLYNANQDGGNGLPAGAPFQNPSDGAGFAAGLGDAMRDRLEQFRDYSSLTPEFRAQMFSDARRSLEGSALEQTLLEAMGTQGVGLARAANPRLDIPADADVRDEIVADRVSPFRNGGYLTLLRQSDPSFNPALNRPGRIYEPDLASLAFQDPNLASVINLMPASWTDDQIGVWFRRRILLWVMLHELGHSLGMEHNFAGSIDRNNYLDDWYAIDGANPLPKSEDYGLDTAPTAEDLEQYAADTRAARDLRDNAGIAMHQYTSVMDYMGLAERMTPKLGKYDHAVVSWSYGNQVEIYTGDPRTGIDDFTLDPTRAGRTWMTHYIGGETCEQSTDCPGHDPSAPMAQRCLQNPRYERQPALCKPGDGDVDCVCSSYEEDVKEASLNGYDCDGNGAVSGTSEINWDCDGDENADHWPVDYMTCSNDRLADISWCNQFDRGSSFREVVQNMRDSYNRYYPWRNFRHHDPMFGQFSAAGAVSRAMYDAVKIYQHLLYRYFYEEDFAARNGALGFWDEMLASVDTMNWMNSILAQPDVGSYDLGEDQVFPDGTSVPVLRRVSDLDESLGQVDLNMGPGKWIWSQHQGDEYGVFDFQRAGTFFEKMLAYEALARREWGLGYTYDERFYVNFYDFFSTSMEQIYGGALRGDVAMTAGYYDAADNTITFPEVWTGIGDFNGRPEYCLAPLDRIPSDLPAVADHIPLLLREISAAWALSEFAVFYDTAFAQKMYIFVEGSGEGVRIPDADPRDGQPLVEGVDYIRYTSDTRGKTYVSMQVDPPVRFPGCHALTYDDGDPGTVDASVYGSISFQLLSDARSQQERLQALRADPGADPEEVERVRLDVANRDSLIELLLDMQRRFGISSYFL